MPLPVSIGFLAPGVGDVPLGDYVRLAEIADRYPFDSLTVGDNLFAKSAWSLLTLIATRTRRVRLGPSVTHPYVNHPITIAREVAALDEVSGGRAILGIGKGSLYEMYGMRAAKPLTTVREAILMVNRLLAGDRGAFDGTAFRAMPEAGLAFRAPRLRVPVFVGTVGPRMCEMAGEVADEVRCVALCSPAYVKVVKEHVAIGAARAGRDPGAVRITADLWTYISSDRARAHAVMRRILAERMPLLGALVEFIGVPAAEVRAVGAAWAAGEKEKAAALVSPETLGKMTVCGTVTDVVHQVRALEAAGVQHVTLKSPLGPDPAEAIRIIGEEVLPAL